MILHKILAMIVSSVAKFRFMNNLFKKAIIYDEEKLGKESYKKVLINRKICLKRCRYNFSRE